MLYREIIAICSQIQTKHINTVCGQNVELLNVKLGVIHKKHVDLQGYSSYMAAAIRHWNASCTFLGHTHSRTLFLLTPCDSGTVSVYSEFPTFSPKPFRTVFRAT